MNSRSSARRNTRIGRWAPVLFYSANVITWLGIGVAAGAWDLIPLVALPMAPVVFYAARTGRGRRES